MKCQPKEYLLQTGIKQVSNQKPPDHKSDSRPIELPGWPNWTFKKLQAFYKQYQMIILDLFMYKANWQITN